MGIGILFINLLVCAFCAPLFVLFMWMGWGVLRERDKPWVEVKPGKWVQWNRWYYQLVFPLTAIFLGGIGLTVPIERIVTGHTNIASVWYSPATPAFFVLSSIICYHFLVSRLLVPRSRDVPIYAFPPK
jgi:hypothetical protein